MNVVFWLLIILGLALVWFGLSFLFKDIGVFFRDLFRDAKGAAQEDDDDEENNIF